MITSLFFTGQRNTRYLAKISTEITLGHSSLMGLGTKGHRYQENPEK